MRLLFPLMLVAACAGDETTAGDTDDADTDDTDTPASGCTAPSAGSWTLNGTCFGMDMTGTLTAGGDGCSFTLSDWNMEMSSPDGGTVSGDEVTLDWPGKGGCTGTTDGESMQGSCDDGCTWDGAFAG